MCRNKVLIAVLAICSDTVGAPSLPRNGLPMKARRALPMTSEIVGTSKALSLNVAAMFGALLLSGLSVA